ncbi:hypothetical protein H5410_050708 [Solanum commersonii]|uniref:Uncharacterized protein n=1 Tax=Solanum commersonii TaxID=4109 RepID=A0A9J5WW77_SOLCO|nr:hypothetical protein H5410_050708 [Solanum commersonii]
MLDISIDCSRLTLRINVNAIPSTEPTNSFNDVNDLMGNERLGDHSKERMSDNSNESLGVYSMNIHDDPTNVGNQPVDEEDPEPKPEPKYSYLLAYMHSINVVPLESKWCVPKELLNVKILPPLVDTKLGRKRRKCYKGVHENFKSKRRNKCSICKRTGHNRTTCVNNNESYTSLIELVL